MSEKTGKKQNWFKRHKIITGIVVLLMIIGIASGGSSSNSNTPTANTTATTKASAKTANTKPADTTAKLNQPANDGKFQFTATDIKCNQAQVESPDPDSFNDASTTGAPYCVLTLSVKNISTQAQTFDDSTQYLYDTAGKQYSVDDQATVTANTLSSTFMELPSINPGVTATGTLVFDVPASATISYGMFHDSSLSNGIKILMQ
jgi:hypothetical protein